MKYLLLLSEQVSHQNCKEGRNVLFNSHFTMHSTHFIYGYKPVYGIGHMIKDHSDNEIRNPLPGYSF